MYIILGEFKSRYLAHSRAKIIPIFIRDNRDCNNSSVILFSIYQLV